MSVQNVILFVSSNSRVCAEPVQFVRQSGLPVVIVRLDIDTDRQNAIQGKYFQIHSVPTLLVIHGDGNIQLFQGREKIMEWLQQTFSQMRRNEKKQNKPDSVEEPAEDSDEEYEEKQKKRKPPKKKSKKKKRKPVKFVEDSDEDSDEDEESIVFIESEEEKEIPRLSTGGLKIDSQKKTKSQMKSIAEIASQMEKDRKSTLGYREEDLPIQS